MSLKIARAICCFAITLTTFGGALFARHSYAQGTSQLDVQVVTDEADALLAIIEKKKAGRAVEDADWQRLFASEGYTRLKKREASMKRDFTDEDFKAFVLSDDLAARAVAVAETLDRWKKADATASAARALAYLPRGARIQAKIYPVIKPRDNSFVFEVRTQPAIFLYIDPKMTREQFENTLAHELHHIGYANSCRRGQQPAEKAALPQNVQRVLDWVAPFGEGAAMLAAAGGPDTHPHATSSAEDRARWDKDVANFNQDLKKVEKFYLDILEKRLTKDEEMDEVGFSFFGTQGPWYTVGWKMDVVIEKAYGRAKLIECLCDPKLLLVAYNSAAEKHNRTATDRLALWSNQLIEAVTKPGAR